MAITNSVLPLVLERAATVWPDNMTAADFIPNFDVLRGIQEQQTARLDFVNLPDGVDARIAWLNNCDISVEDCTDTCTFTGVEADALKKDISIDQCKQSTFSVKLDEWRDNLFGMSDAVAVNLNKVMVSQLEYVAQQAVVFLNAQDGTNEYTNGGAWTVDSSGTTIPSSAWDTTGIFGKLRTAAIKNRFTNPYLITGENLDYLMYMSETSQANGEGKGDARRIAQMPVYFDLFNVDTVNEDVLATYLLNRGAVAFLSKGYYPTTPQVLDGNHTRFSVRNRFFPQLIHDVERRVACDTGVWAEHWKVKARFDFELNPLGCTATRTGIIKLIKEAGI